MKLPFIALAIVLPLLTACADALDLHEGDSAYKKGNFGTAISKLRPLAEKGNAPAQNTLGLMYHNGDGVEQDSDEAVKWYRKAAEQGYAPAQNNLGVMYDNGLGVALDTSEAATWYRRAADQGNAFAQANLGLMYEQGRGLPVNLEEAATWYQKAAAQNLEKAQVALERVERRQKTESESKSTTVAHSNADALANRDSRRSRSTRSPNLAQSNRTNVVQNMSPEAVHAAQQWTINYYSQRLKDPYSARYTFANIHPYEKGWTLCGTVNAKNSYGGYVGAKPFILFISLNGEVEHITDGSVKYLTEMVEITCRSQ